MSFNPFEEKGTPVDKGFVDWNKIKPHPYKAEDVDPYTKTRIILMNGTEFEANWFGHQFLRHCTDNDLRREITICRDVEKQQQMRIAGLKPDKESILETTISYEQLAVDLTAEMAVNEKDPYVKKALDFALLEDFDHLYRYANLLDMEKGIRAENLVGKYTEIMPGRPTISEHRFPADNVRRSINAKNSDMLTVLNTHIITAGEQQTMNYYMNVANIYPTDLGRRLYQEIGLIEEEHVTQYGSLIDPHCTWLENMLMHEYVECYLYYSMSMDESDSKIKKLWDECLDQEIGHLQNAVRLLKKYEKKDWQSVIPVGEFPQLLKLRSHIDYIRDVLSNTVQFTSVEEDYKRVEDLKENNRYFQFQETVNKEPGNVPTHIVIEDYIESEKKDYRFETKEHPIEALRTRTADNTEVGRKPNAASSSSFDFESKAKKSK